MRYPTTRKSLLERVQSGDEVSWNEFYCRYAPVVRAVAALYRLHPDECDDVVQMVMTKFFGARDRYVYREGDVKFRTYFATVIRSCAVDYIRANASPTGPRAPEPPGEDPFGDRFLEEWRKAVLDEALDELRLRVDGKTYQAFEWYALQGRPVADVTAVLSMTRNQVYLAKSRCTAILREIVSRLNRADGELHLDLP